MSYPNEIVCREGLTYMDNYITGWVKVFRSLINWEWFTDSQTVHLFIYCLLKANIQEKGWRGLTINRGQFVTSYEKMSQETGISLQSVRTRIEKLEKTGEVTRESTNNFTIVTVCNYDTYQQVADPHQHTDQQSTNNQITNDQQTDNKRITTTKEYKNKRSKEIKKNVPTEHGRADINELMDFLGSKDGSIKENRKYCKLLIDKFKKDFPSHDPTLSIKALIEKGRGLDFWGAKITSFKFLYYNSSKIINEIKSTKQGQRDSAYEQYISELGGK